MSHRGNAWGSFSTLVWDHIESYTVPQYGDAPHDQLSEFTIEECAMNMKRYLNRIPRNARGRSESMRDMMKVAHYAQVIHDLLALEEGDDA